MPRVAPKERGPDDPILTVMWRGHRVAVFGDMTLTPPQGMTGRRPESPSGTIANAITGAASVEDIVSALRASEVGRTHDVAVGVREGVLQIRLRRREGSGDG